MIGQVVGSYQILEKLGEGGMGSVYRAVDVMLEREAAVKMLRPEIARQPDLVERFRSEAMTLAKLNHPAIATLYSFFRHGDDYFMAMEYVPGRTLEQEIRESGALPLRRVLAILSMALDGIEHAHRQGVLHRDLKPSNIMLTPTGAAKVLDFGIARILGSTRVTRAGGIVGTMQYIAPERIRGQEADIRSDLYSMGVVFFEMLTGRVPFESDSEYELMKAHLEQNPPTVEKYGIHPPDTVRGALDRALAKNPNERFPDAASFRQAIEASTCGDLKSTPVAIKETRLAIADPDGRPKSRIAAISVRKYSAAAVLLAALVAGGAWMAWLHRPSPKPVELAAVPQPASSPTPVSAPAAPPVASAVGTAVLPAVPAESLHQARREEIFKDSVSIPVGSRGKIAASPSVADSPPPKVAAVPPAPLATAPDTKPAEAVQPGPPLSQSEVLTLLRAGTAASRVSRIVEVRGASFQVNTESSREIQEAGGNRPLLLAIMERYIPAQPAAPAVAVAVPSAPTPPPPASKNDSASMTIEDVRSVYIEPMSDDFHFLIKDELHRQLGNRWRVVDSSEQADAVMTVSGGSQGGAGSMIGVQSNAVGSVRVRSRSTNQVLWTGEAGSRRILGGLIQKGGPRKVAERLVGDLRKRLQ